MPLVKKCPNHDPDIILTQKEAILSLGITARSMVRYRNYGWIDTIPAATDSRPMYWGAAVNKLFYNIVTRGLTVSQTNGPWNKN